MRLGSATTPGRKFSIVKREESLTVLLLLTVKAAYH
jgi:hypothetical protein